MRSEIDSWCDSVYFANDLCLGECGQFFDSNVEHPHFY